MNTIPATKAELLAHCEMLSNTHAELLADIQAGKTPDCYVVSNARGPVYYNYGIDGKPRVFITPEKASRYSDLTKASKLAEQTRNGAGQVAHVEFLSNACMQYIQTVEELIQDLNG